MPPFSFEINHVSLAPQSKWIWCLANKSSSNVSRHNPLSCHLLCAGLHTGMTETRGFLEILALRVGAEENTLPLKVCFNWLSDYIPWNQSWVHIVPKLLSFPISIILYSPCWLGRRKKNQFSFLRYLPCLVPDFNYSLESSGELWQ